MTTAKINLLFSLSLLIFISLACSSLSKLANSNANSSNSIIARTNTNRTATNRPPTLSEDDAETPTGVEKNKPAAGKANLQGKILFNEKPVEGIEVTLCEKFSTIMGIQCTGKKYKTKSDADGVFVLANAEPIEYQGLMAKIFNSDKYYFQQKSVMTAMTYTLSADKTTFARDMHLFKPDLKTTAPKSGAKVDANGLQLTWDAYGDATYYKVYLYSDDAKTPSPYTGERVESNSFAVDKTLTNGKYRLKVEAYNQNDRKLAESTGDTKFTVTGGAEPAAAN